MKFIIRFGNLPPMVVSFSHINESKVWINVSEPTSSYPIGVLNVFSALLYCRVNYKCKKIKCQLLFLAKALFNITVISIVIKITTRVGPKANSLFNTIL